MKREIKHEIERLDSRVEKLEKEIKQIQCSHALCHREFISISGWPFGPISYEEKCTNCGKILESFDNYEKFSEANMKWHEQKAKAIKKTLPKKEVKK